MDLRVTHETRYDYVPLVETAQHMACLLPVDTPCQRVRASALHVDPAPSRVRDQRDVYGNRRSFFALQLPHDSLRVTAVSDVSTRPARPAHSRVTWEAVRERFRYRVGGEWDAETEFVFASPHVPRHDDFGTYARPSFAAGVPLLIAARDLMARIHADFTYTPHSTEVNTPTVDALARRKGVCQDFAHILIACLRAMGVAARYVSGYLLTQPAPGQPRLIGADASHAWAQVYLPDLPGAADGCGWYDLDPTNNREGWCSPGEDYVTLATGRDYADVSPIRGVIHGGARHTLTVAVTVEPLDPPEVAPTTAKADTTAAAEAAAHTLSEEKP